MFIFRLQITKQFAFLFLMKLASPCVSKITAKNRLLSVSEPFTRGTFKDTREQAEKLFAALVANGATVQMTSEDIGKPFNGFGSIRQFVRVNACGHSFNLVLVHCLCDIGTQRAYGDLSFYTV